MTEPSPTSACALFPRNGPAIKNVAEDIRMGDSLPATGYDGWTHHRESVHPPTEVSIIAAERGMAAARSSSAI